MAYLNKLNPRQGKDFRNLRIRSRFKTERIDNIRLKITNKSFVAFTYLQDYMLAKTKRNIK